MSTSKDGGPAFPTPDTYHANGQVEYGNYGMTLRDWFAGQALAMLGPELARSNSSAERNDCSNWSDDVYPSFDDPLDLQCPAGRAARSAYAIADAMLAARERKEGAQ